MTSRQHCIQAPTLAWVEQHFPGVFAEVHFGNHWALEGQSKAKSEICRCAGSLQTPFSTPEGLWRCAQGGCTCVHAVVAARPGISGRAKLTHSCSCCTLLQDLACWQTRTHSKARHMLRKFCPWAGRDIGATVLIDDNPRYAVECAAAGIDVLLYDWNLGYPWSKTPEGCAHACPCAAPAVECMCSAVSCG